MPSSRRQSYKGENLRYCCEFFGHIKRGKRAPFLRQNPLFLRSLPLPGDKYGAKKTRQGACGRGKKILNVTRKLPHGIVARTRHLRTNINKEVSDANGRAGGQTGGRAGRQAGGHTRKGVFRQSREIMRRICFISERRRRDSGSRRDAPLALLAGWALLSAEGRRAL